jgi:type IV fimbrial biogenesis protein FimT
MTDRRLSGFTLIELLITVAVLAVLVAVGYPSFSNTLRSNRLATASSELVAGIALARSEAIRSTRSSGMCPSNDGVNCGADWSKGWIVWGDVNGDATFSAADALLRYSQGDGMLSISSGQAKKLLFDRRGRVVAYGTSATSGTSTTALSGVQTLTLESFGCQSGQAFQRTLTINPSGQVRVSKGNCS